MKMAALDGQVTGDMSERAERGSFRGIKYRNLLVADDGHEEVESNVHLPAREAKDTEVRRAIVGRDIKEGYAIPRRGRYRHLRMVSRSNDGATRTLTKSRRTNAVKQKNRASMASRRKRCDVAEAESTSTLR